MRSESACQRRLWQPLSVHIRSHPPTHPRNPSMNVKNRRPDHNTGNYVPYSCEQCVGSLTSHKVIMNKGCETGPTIYRPYPRRLDSLTIIITKAALSPQLFKDSEYWSGRGLNLRPPARESGALPTEPTGRRLSMVKGRMWLGLNRLFFTLFFEVH